VFGFTFDKLLVIAVIAVFLLGPERLPGYAAQLARLVRNIRNMADGAKDRLREEMGPDFDDVDWKKLDPRQYDPRRIIREALLENDEPIKPVSATVRPAESAFAKRQKLEAAGDAAPFDNEAT
jgi:sec-independent protein translocase protein TatB